MTHPVASAKNNIELLHLIKSSNLDDLFQRDFMHDVRFLSKSLDNSYQPIAHTLAGLHRFQLGQAQSEEVLGIKNEDGFPLSYVLMRARSGGFSRQIREINQRDAGVVLQAARTSPGKLSMLNTIRARAPALFDDLWPLTPALHLPVVKRTFSCIHPSVSPEQTHNLDEREIYKKNPIRLTAFDALGADEQGNVLTESRKKLALWFHDSPELWRFVKERIQKNPTMNPSDRYQHEIAGYRTYTDSVIFLLLLEHYQKSAQSSPFMPERGTNESWLSELVDMPISGYGVVKELPLYMASMQEWIETLPPALQEEQRHILTQTLQGLKPLVLNDWFTAEAEHAFSIALHQAKLPLKTAQVRIETAPPKKSPCRP